MARTAFSKIIDYRPKWFLLSVAVTASSVWIYGWLFSSQNVTQQSIDSSAQVLTDLQEESDVEGMDSGVLPSSQLESPNQYDSAKSLDSANKAFQTPLPIQNNIENNGSFPADQSLAGVEPSRQKYAVTGGNPNDRFQPVSQPHTQRKQYPRFDVAAQPKSLSRPNRSGQRMLAEGGSTRRPSPQGISSDYFATQSSTQIDEVRRNGGHQSQQNLEDFYRPDGQVRPSSFVESSDQNSSEDRYDPNRFDAYQTSQDQYRRVPIGQNNHRNDQRPANYFEGHGGDPYPIRQADFGSQERDVIPGRGPRRGQLRGPNQERVRGPKPLLSIASRDPESLRLPSTDPKTTPGGGKPKQYQKKELPGGVGSTNFQLAAQPKAGDHYESRPPIIAADAFFAPYSKDDFAPDPMGIQHYDPYAQQQIYQGKSLNSNQRPLLELFKPWYQLGQLPPSKTWLGRHNPVVPQFLLFGDYRTAVASNTQNGNNFSVWAHRLNLDFDFRLTSTERFHWFMGPLDRGGQFTRFVRDNDDLKFISEFDPDIDFGYLEGDLGALWGGFSKTSLPFDMPFAIGNMPLLFQNGVWFEDAFVGFAFTIPAKNSPALDISNYDITFLFGYDKITSPAFGNDDNAAKLYGVASFIEAAGGYFEIDYAFLEDRTNFNRSYHNSSIAFTRRYGRFISNSIRVINNAGQNPNGIEQTADGTLLLFENSLITRNPITFIPYFNTFIGFDTPQSAARAGGSGGVLRNTGILFESDGLTGFPTLDANAKNAFGGAVGLNILAKDLSQQLILEAAMVQPFSGKQSSAAAEQFGLGARYQLPLSNAIILRMDAMVGFNDGQVDRHGARIELRHKW